MEDEDKIDNLFREAFDRLRETEAQTREQNVKLDTLCSRLETFSNVTDRFFELEDKRHIDDEKRFAKLCEIEENREKAEERRFDKLWKLIAILIGALVALALGQKAADKIIQTWKENPAIVYSNPLAPWHDDGFGINRNQKS